MKYTEGKLKLWSHSQISNCLIEVATKAGLTKHLLKEKYICIHQVSIGN